MSLIGSLFDAEFIMPILIFGIPIVAIIGGITSGIVKTMTEARIVENAQRERIAAIQAGIDPAKLPPVPSFGSTGAALAAIDPDAAARHRHQGLLVGGIVTTFVGAGLMTFLYVMVDASENVWAVGIIPLFVGVALFISAWVVKPRKQT
jgi:hypothetical protein